MNGKLYYNLHPVRVYDTTPGFACVDLRTGETVWTNKEGIISKGQLTNYPSPNQYGVVPGILWATVGTTWHMYDAFTGDLILTFKNATTGGSFAIDNNGNMLYHMLDQKRLDGYVECN